ncbi:MAG: NAD(P)/FAD-dependent oxidoreductase [Gemmatimonadaceae bacterium]|nr:NAD(P)/FAD-dependent oxidoreductase [Gemmatimonadaceae bacterium]
MNTHDLVDITIIGGGPTGLFARFYAGMRGVSCRIVDALPEPGGQLAALYPEKYIFDVAGFTKVLARDLVRALVEQSRQFGAPEFLNQRVVALEEVDGHFVLVTSTDRFPTRAIVLAAGIGAFTPRRLPQAAAQPWYGRGIHDVMGDPAQYHGKRVVIIGGGDSAFDWTAQLVGKAERVSLVHRTDRFRAHGATVSEVMQAVERGDADLFTFHELHDILAVDAALAGIVLRETKTKATKEVPSDVVLPMLGYVSDLGDVSNWGLTITNDEIHVNSQMETGRPGIWAAGDVTTYPGKLKLIAAGFGEAATAVNQAVHWLHPEKKVAPGHSSNMGIFGQTPD